MNATLPSGRELLEAIDALRVERDALVLAHYYQEPEIQDLADFVGDSLELAKKARDAQQGTILFCGVHFMAETAKILNPTRRVLVPDLDAGCSLAEACPPDELAAWKAEHPDHLVVTYINSTAATKALSDIICTSSNAARVVASLPADRPILFAPDRNLGAWVQRETGRAMDVWPGACIVHETFSEKALLRLQLEHPDALVVAHPECEPHLLAHADFVGSTSKLLRFTESSSAPAFIVATEPGILHQMRKARPEALYLELPGVGDSCSSCNACPYMRLNTLEKIYLALRDGAPEVDVPEALREAARVPLDRMMDLG